MKLIKQAIENPIQHQNKILESNIKICQDTLFGQEHNFNKIKTYHHFKQLVPVRDYENIKPYIRLTQERGGNILWPGKVKWFAKSSGTTQNKSKFIHDQIKH